MVHFINLKVLWDAVKLGEGGNKNKNSGIQLFNLQEKTNTPTGDHKA